MDVRGLDPATAKLAIELQLADVNAILAGTDTKAADHMAFETLKESLLHTLQLLTGQVLAMTVLRADHDNLVVFQGLVREERQAAQDHDIARDLGGLVTEQPSSLGPEHHSKDQESWLSNDDAVFPYYASIAGIPEESTIATPNKSQSIFPCGQELSKLNVFAESRAEASDSANQRYSKGKRKADEHITHTLCSSCMDRHPRFDVIELGCKRKGDVAYHAYCRSCLVGLFKSSLTDTTLFPPRCCGIRIPLSACVHLCPLELVKQYEDKEIELASPNPVYCSNRFCAEFIKPGNVVADIATCRTCKTETCTICKNPRHKGLCPEDPTVQMLMEVAGEKRWQRCHKCRTMVELVVGCYHMRYV
jgi:E3 ubiquitin-protein ligase RNF144